jgi:hypothetical protein
MVVVWIFIHHLLVWLVLVKLRVNHSTTLIEVVAILTCLWSFNRVVILTLQVLRSIEGVELVLIGLKVGTHASLCSRTIYIHDSLILLRLLTISLLMQRTT